VLVQESVSALALRAAVLAADKAMVHKVDQAQVIIQAAQEVQAVSLTTLDKIVQNRMTQATSVLQTAE
jgi:hypothetical protein